MLLRGVSNLYDFLAMDNIPSNTLLETESSFREKNIKLLQLNERSLQTYYILNRYFDPALW